MPNKLIDIFKANEETVRYSKFMCKNPVNDRDEMVVLFIEDYEVFFDYGKSIIKNKKVRGDLPVFNGYYRPLISSEDVGIRRYELNGTLYTGNKYTILLSFDIFEETVTVTTTPTKEKKEEEGGE